MAKTLEDLNKLYLDGEEADSRAWAEMRSNLLLVAGDHYAKLSMKFSERIRDTKDLSQDTKLRLTRNHMSRLSNIYINAILSLATNTAMKPTNPKELQDQKAAQLHNSVWGYMQKKQNIPQKRAEMVQDLVNFGECAIKLYWDWNKGYFKGFGQSESKNEDGHPILDENGQPQMEEDQTKTLWSGDLVHERLYAFNIFRPKACQDMNDAEWIGIRKMTDKKVLEKMINDMDGDQTERLKALDDQSKTTYMVFDVHKANYEMSKDQIMLREIYYRPSPIYPKGYFYIFTQSGILWDGELPFGIFPIVWQGFKSVPTSPRALSPIKDWKPYQVEINRVASKMAEHQITLGDDKLVSSNNAKLSSAGAAPGVRMYTTSGPNTPVWLPGRTGDQYLPYLQSTITELYQTAQVAEMLEEKPPAQVDAYAMLLTAARWKEKFSIHTNKFVRFQIKWTETAMDLYRNYVPDDEAIQQIGKSEQVNISEFKSATQLCYQIEVEESNDDVESRMGRQLTLNHIIQFAGQNMDKRDLGKLFRQLPYLDNEEMLKDMTLDYDNATNDILALERGEQPPIAPGDDHAYVAQRLRNRIREADFKFLPQPVQQNFNMLAQAHEQAEIQKQQTLQRAKDGFIPTTGYLVTTQVYAPDPNNPKLTKPLRLPYDAIAWLAKQLEAQGMGQTDLQNMSQQALQQLGNQAMQARANQLPPGGQGGVIPMVR